MPDNRERLVELAEQYDVTVTLRPDGSVANIDGARVNTERPQCYIGDDPIARVVAMLEPGFCLRVIRKDSDV